MKKITTLLALALCLNGWAQIITTVAGNGTGGYSGDGGQATSARINGAYNLTVDSKGNIYIADRINSCIRMVNTLGIISTIAGTDTVGFSGDGGPATAAKLDWTNGVAIDNLGNIYVSDESNRVRKINTLGIINTVVGTGTQGYTGDGGPATAAELNGPIGLAIDAAGNLYIADNDNNVIRKVNSVGIISTVAGHGIPPNNHGYAGDGGQATDANLYLPYYVAVDLIGNLYISDGDNFKIRKVNSLGIITTFAGSTTATSSGMGGQATAAGIGLPGGVAADTEGNVYFSDVGNCVVYKVDTSGIINIIAGNSHFGYAGDNGAAIVAELNRPSGITLDKLGNLYIADLSNNRIRKVTNATTAGIKEIALSSEGVLIYPNPTNGVFVIEPSNETKQIMQVYDVTGKIVLSQSINGKTIIDANSLNEGIYNINLQSNEGLVNKRVVIVK